MEKSPRYQSNAWSVPVPMCPSHLCALNPDHQKFNVQVDLGQLTSFGYPTENSDDTEFLYADLQSRPIEPVGLRLGSGRAGFYRGKYLKGVGRTQLAGNWRNRTDVYHATGHMQASAAVREYIVSCYLRAKGAAHTIVPCEGILLGPLHNNLLGYEKSLSQYGEMIPIDLRFQAISVKDGQFARHSNFVWALNHTMFTKHYAWLFESLYHYATVTCAQLPATRVGPTEIARALSESTKQGFGYYEEYLRHGIYWGSFNNNFTLDGRFLDIELPQIFGCPFFGLLTRREEPPQEMPIAFIGCEAMSYLAQVRRFIEYLVRRLRFLLDANTFIHPKEQEFAAALLAAVESKFDADHVLMNREACTGTIFSWLLRNLEVPASNHNTLRRIVHYYYDEAFSCRPLEQSNIDYKKLSLKLASSEFNFHYNHFYPNFLDMDTRRDEAVHINRSLNEIDQSKSLEKLMQGIEQLAGDIRKMSASIPNSSD